MRGTKTTSASTTSNSPSGWTPVAVRIETLPLLTDVGSTRSENLKCRRWFSAISDTEQPVCEQPRSQLMMQNDWPPAHLMRTELESSDEPPEQPGASSSRPAK